MTPALAFKFAVRDWRAGELRLLIAALLVAVGSVSAISLFVDRLQRAIEVESTSFLGADRVIGGSREIPEEFRDLARERGLELADVITFNSMVFADASGSDRNQLASVKAVAPGYPLRGTVRIADAPFDRGTPTADVPAPGEVWLDSRLFPSLGVDVGDRVAVGYAEFTVGAVLTSEPDRGGGSLFDFGPRLLMRVEDIPATRVVQPGSRIGYTLMLAGRDEDLRSLYVAIRDDLRPNYGWRSIRDANASIGRALDRAESFLLLGGLLAVLLAGIAVALAANRYARRHFDHVGVLKTLGATPREIQWGYLGVLLVIGVAGTVLGLALGGIVHLGIIGALGDLLPPTLPLPGLRPLVVGSVTGFVCLLAFALPPLLGLKKISPMRVIRRDLGTAVAPVVTYGFAAAGSIALLVWHSGSVILTVAALIGAVVTGGVFAVMALVLLRGGRVIGMQAGSTWRLALAGLQRRYKENVAQIVIFGFAIMLLLVMLLVRTALVDDWQAEIPERTPNHFLINVPPDEAEDVQRMLTDRTDYDGELFPMIRGRISAVNDTPVRDWRRRRGPGPGIRGERNLTFAREPPPNNVVVEGEWWDTSEGADTEPAVSLEDDYARGIGVSVGDTLTFDIGGLPLTVRVANTRMVEWDSLQPNFFIIFSPGALAGYPATFMTSFHLPREQKPFLNELLAAHPTVTLIEVDEIIVQVRSIIDRVTQTVELVLYLVLGAGVLVLIASIGSSRDQRLREHALLRALGGERRLIQGALVTEFAVLGFFAGLVAVIGAELSVYTLNREIFELPTDLHPWLWAAGPGIGVAMIATVGYLGTRKLVRSPPATVLREV